MYRNAVERMMRLQHARMVRSLTELGERLRREQSRLVAEHKAIQAKAEQDKKGTQGAKFTQRTTQTRAFAPCRQAQGDPETNEANEIK